jgi:hypothetical protein
VDLPDPPIERVPCVLHRWFVGGENWAHHPRIGLTELHRIVAALRQPLESRQRGVFRVEVQGGVVVGELLDDPDCPDRRARTRDPFLLRAAFVPFALDEQATRSVLSALRALPAIEAPGEHSDLTIPVARPTRPHSPCRRAGVSSARPRAGLAKGPSCSRISSRRWVWFLLAGVLVLPLALGSIVFVGSRSASRHERSLSASHVAIDAGGLRDVGPPPEFAEWIDRLDHPYTVYLRTFPSAWGGRARTPPPIYEEWRLGEGQRAYRDRDRPLPRALRATVERYRRPRELVEPARAVAGLLHRWTGRPESPEPRADASCLRTLDEFFLHLSRPIGLPRPGELDHPRNRFLWRLPPDPVAEGLVIENEVDLARHLEELLRKLGGRPESGILGLGWRSLLRQIELELDYNTWLTRQSQVPFVLPDSADPGPMVQSEFERRFGGLSLR